ncbi:hypothetical protein TNCV_4564891 [Trichonephila clavipes]|nr:hypothetical protein TNCV_4564891 [Trichonephila clavipes]
MAMRKPTAGSYLRARPRGDGRGLAIVIPTSVKQRVIGAAVTCVYAYEYDDQRLKWDLLLNTIKYQLAMMIGYYTNLENTANICCEFID